MTPVRDPAHLRRVRALPCLYCKRSGADVQAHHEGKREHGGGTGLKGCDLHTVPLCAVHHAEYHRRACIGFWTTEQTRAKFEVAIERMKQRYGSQKEDQ